MKTVVLLRTHRFGAREAAFAGRLQRESGHAVYILADETRQPLDTSGFAKISISSCVAGGLGLPCPKDFGWRCGDYGFYAARAALPDASHFWLVEPDVYFSMANLAEAFEPFSACEADFIAPHLMRAEKAHFWYPTMRWRTADVYRCGFAFCRISAEAVDACLVERRRQATMLPARIMWPNDETFVATVLHRGGFSVADLNAAGRIACTEHSFGFADPHRGEQLATTAFDGLIYHPVLFGEDYTRKTARIERGLSIEERVRLKLLRGLAKLQCLAGLPGETLP